MITAYRCHIHPMAMGVDPKRIMAELCGKVTGTSHEVTLCDAEPYRTKEEVGMMKNEDPIELVKSRILANNWATESELEAIDEKSKEFVEECVEFMENSAYPDVSQVYDFVYSEPDYPFIDKLEN
ncbi:hypothetical protein FQR65_LT14984 [Abscondita terminalis]|nr:hypothetical protein FQR65_LT14984 [Abscondita terminalis]